MPGGTLVEALAFAGALSGLVAEAPPFCAQPAASTDTNNIAVQIFTLMTQLSLIATDANITRLLGRRLEPR
jgi:hypothetical protein